jgi:hypothetical protein
MQINELAGFIDCKPAQGFSLPRIATSTGQHLFATGEIGTATVESVAVFQAQLRRRSGEVDCKVVEYSGIGGVPAQPSDYFFPTACL